MRIQQFAAATIAVAGLALAAAPALAQPAPMNMDEQGLRWERPPSIMRMGRLYPRRAIQQGVTRARVDLSCTPQASGRLDCRVTHEDHEGLGFGRAGVQVMDRATVAAVDGGPVQGRTFAFTLRFGNWPAELLPDAFQPSHAGLHWVVRPEMGHWDLAGQGRGETYRADFDCVAAADGALACELAGTEPTGIDRFAEAASEAMAEARVRRVDGGSPEGVRFGWSIGITRRSQ